MTGINYAARRLKESAVELINDSGLPLVVIRGVLQELLEQAKDLEAEAILQEKAAEESAEEKEESDRG